MLVRLSRFQSGGNGAGRPAGFKPVGPVCKTGRRFDSIPRKGLVQLNNRRFLSPQAVKEIKERVRQVIKKNGGLTLGDCKEVFAYGRTVGVPVLEYLDSIGFTRREENGRVLKTFNYLTNFKGGKR